MSHVEAEVERLCEEFEIKKDNVRQMINKTAERGEKPEDLERRAARLQRNAKTFQCQTMRL